MFKRASLLFLITNIYCDGFAHDQHASTAQHLPDIAETESVGSTQYHLDLGSDVSDTPEDQNYLPDRTQNLSRLSKPSISSKASIGQNHFLNLSGSEFTASPITPSGHNSSRLSATNSSTTHQFNPNSNNAPAINLTLDTLAPATDASHSTHNSPQHSRAPSNVNYAGMLKEIAAAQEIQPPSRAGSVTSGHPIATKTNPQSPTSYTPNTAVNVESTTDSPESPRAEDYAQKFMSSSPNHSQLLPTKKFSGITKLVPASHTATQRDLQKFCDDNAPFYNRILTGLKALSSPEVQALTNKIVALPDGDQSTLSSVIDILESGAGVLSKLSKLNETSRPLLEELNNAVSDHDDHASDDISNDPGEQSGVQFKESVNSQSDTNKVKDALQKAADAKQAAANVQEATESVKQTHQDVQKFAESIKKLKAQNSNKKPQSAGNDGCGCGCIIS